MWNDDPLPSVVNDPLPSVVNNPLPIVQKMSCKDTRMLTDAGIYEAMLVLLGGHPFQSMCCN